MPRRAAHITQADVARVIRAARQAGATEVEVRVAGQSSIVIRIGQAAGPDTVNETANETALGPGAEIVL